MGALRKALNVPFGLPLRRFVLEAGAVVIGTETELVLKSRWVMPARLREAGYEFNFEDIDGALNDLVKNTKANKPSTSCTFSSVDFG